jgi:hypothetical protein
VQFARYLVFIFQKSSGAIYQVLSFRFGFLFPRSPAVQLVR